MPTPGASRSGFAAKSIHVGPSELNEACRSSLRGVVPEVRRGADRQHPGRIAGARDAAELRSARCCRVLAHVAGGGDDDDAGVNRALGGERERIGRERLEHAGRDREVDDADVVGVLDRDRVVDRVDDVADVAVPVCRRAPSATRAWRAAPRRCACRRNRTRCRR